MNIDRHIPLHDEKQKAYIDLKREIVWRGQSGPMPAGAAGCSKEIPRPWNAKGTRRNMGWVLVSKSLTLPSAPPQGGRSHLMISHLPKKKKKKKREIVIVVVRALNKRPTKTCEEFKPNVIMKGFLTFQMVNTACNRLPHNDNYSLN